MKVTSALLFFCIIGCAVAQFSTCFKVECVKGGEVCGYPNNNTTRVGCRGDSVCSASFSTLATGICQPTAKLGETCSNSDGPSCEDGTSCVAISNNKYVCTLDAPISGSGYLFPGESCNADVQCIYSSPFGLSNDLAACKSGKCKAVKTGDYCNGDYQCNYNNAYCSTSNKCTKYISDGDACYMDDRSEEGCGKNGEKSCMPNSQSGNAGTCRRRHTQKEGLFCTDIDDCKEGLYCQSSSSGYGICTKPSTSTATYNLPCPLLGCNVENNEVCGCTEDGNRCVVNVRPSGYHNAYWSNRECQRKHNCQGNFACIKEQCKSQSCKLYKVNRKLSTTLEGCSAEGLCNSAFALVASPVLAFLAIVVVFAL